METNQFIEIVPEHREEWLIYGIELDVQALWDDPFTAGGIDGSPSQLGEYATFLWELSERDEMDVDTTSIQSTGSEWETEGVLISGGGFIHLPYADSTAGAAHPGLPYRFSGTWTAEPSGYLLGSRTELNFNVVTVSNWNSGNIGGDDRCFVDAHLDVEYEAV